MVLLVEVRDLAGSEELAEQMVVPFGTMKEDPGTEYFLCFVGRSVVVRKGNNRRFFSVWGTIMSSELPPLDVIDPIVERWGGFCLR